MTQLHVNIEESLYRKLKVALKKRGYGSISEWVREMARNAVKEAELKSNNIRARRSKQS